MRRIEFDPKRHLPAEVRAKWDAWEKKATAARDEALDAVAKGEEPTLKSHIWADLKDLLLEIVFYKQCAYCETNISAAFYGDAEHYRPKGRVTRGETGREKEVVNHGSGVHPGYFWLAYDWRNLLPSCQLCNQADGKLNQFPIAGNAWVYDFNADPDALDALEQPLLLHPFRGPDPTEHLVFLRDGRVVAAEGSLHGERSIKVYALDRAELVVQRALAQKAAMAELLGSMFQGVDAVTQLVKDLEAGKRPYSQAALSAVRAAHEQYNAVIQGGRRLPRAPEPRVDRASPPPREPPAP